MTDEMLVELLFAHQETALEALTAQYGPYCRTVAGHILPDERDVEECLNDCWLTVWNAIPPARPEHFRGWLGAVVRNRAIAIGKRNSRLAPPGGGDRPGAGPGPVPRWGRSPAG